jgi:hypothetical protein
MGGGGGGSGAGARTVGALDVAAFGADPAGALPLSGVDEDLLPHPATVSKREIATTRVRNVARMEGSRNEVRENIQPTRAAILNREVRNLNRRLESPEKSFATERRSRNEAEGFAEKISRWPAAQPAAA